MAFIKEIKAQSPDPALKQSAKTAEVWSGSISKTSTCK